MQDDNKEILVGIFEKLQSIDTKVDSQNERIKILEGKLNSQNIPEKKIEAIREPQPTISGFTPPAPPVPGGAREILSQAADTISKAVHMDSYTEGGDKQIPIPPVTEIEEDSTKVDTISFEEQIGGRWFAKIGIFVTVLGISFFLKYAFDNDWIGETARVLMGVIAGIILLGIGEKTIRKYFMYGQLLAAGGLAVLYLSIFAAFNFYSLIPHITAFAFMGMVSAIGIALSLRYNAPALIIGSTLGGFLTPFLIPTKVNIRDILFLYMVMLDLAVLVVSVFKKWRWLNLIGFIGTLILFSSWSAQHYSDVQLVPTVLFLTIFFVIYSLSSLSYNLYKKEESSGIEQVMTLFTGIIYFASIYGLLEGDYYDLLGLFSMLIAVYYFVLAYMVRSITPRDNNLYNFLAFLSVGFVTIAIPIQFNEFVVTILWTLESAFLSALALKIKKEKGGILQIFAMVIFTFALFRVVFVDHEMYRMNSWFLLNKVFISAFVMIVVCYIIAYSATKLKDYIKNGKKVIATFMVLASFVTVFAVSRDIIVYHKNVIEKEYARVSSENMKTRAVNGVDVSEYRVEVDHEMIKSRRERGSTALSLFWIFYSVIIIAIGMFRNRKEMIGFGVGVSIVVLVKSFLGDLWNLDTLHRPFINFIVVFSCYLLAAMFYEYRKISKIPEKFVNIKKLIIFFLITANVLGIFAGSREIELYYEKEAKSLRSDVSEVCQSSYYKKTYGSNSYREYSKNYDSEACKQKKEELRRLASKSSVSLSLFWMLYAIILLVVGFVKRFKWVRIGGIVLLLISIVKLFFVDLWSLGQLYRIIASISLGMVLLVISFAYQKYKDKIREII